MQPDRKIEHLHPAFRVKILKVLGLMNEWGAVHLPDHRCAIAEGFRSVARQQELYAQGRTAPGEIVTEKDGTTNPSNHQSCLAADLAFEHGRNLTWDVPQAAWEYLQHCAHLEGLTSGSDWKTFKDRPHLEWPTSDKATYAAAHSWKAAAGLK